MWVCVLWAHSLSPQMGFDWDPEEEQLGDCGTLAKDRDDTVTNIDQGLWGSHQPWDICVDAVVSSTSAAGRKYSLFWRVFFFSLVWCKRSEKSSSEGSRHPSSEKTPPLFPGPHFHPPACSLTGSTPSQAGIVSHVHSLCSWAWSAQFPYWAGKILGTTSVILQGLWALLLTFASVLLSCWNSVTIGMSLHFYIYR